MLVDLVESPNLRAMDQKFVVSPHCSSTCLVEMEVVDFVQLSNWSVVVGSFVASIRCCSLALLVQFGQELVSLVQLHNCFSVVTTKFHDRFQHNFELVLSVLFV